MRAKSANRWFLACGLTFMVTRPSPARADDARVALAFEWHVPPGERCPSADEVTQQVTRLVGPARRDRGVIRARAEVRKLDDSRFRMQLTTLADGVEGRRVIEERSCTQMAEAAAVILAWMVDPSAIDAPAPAEPKAEPPPMVSHPLAENRRAFKLVFGARGLLDWGTLPTTAYGVGIDLGIRWSAFRIMTRGGLWAHQVTEVAPTSATAATGASFGLLTFGIDACVTPLRIDIAACAGPEIDRIEGTGFGVDVPRTDTASWVSLAFGLEGRIGLVGPLGLTSSASLAFPTSRETFGLDGVAIVHRPGIAAVRAALGLDVMF